MAIAYAVPAWLLITIIALLFAAAACGGHVLVRRSFPATDFIQHNEVAGFIIGVTGVLYAVLLAFMTVIVWEHFSQADERAHEEVDAATDIYRLATHLQAPDRVRLSADVDRYVRAVAYDEWPKMKTGGASAEAQRLVIALLADIADVHVPTLRDANLQSRLLDRVQVTSDLRRRRINDNQSGIPPVMWFALLLGAAVVIGFVYLFGLKNFRVQLLMTAATAILLGVSFGTVVVLDYPFRGDVSVSPERWISLQHTIEHDRP